MVIYSLLDITRTVVRFIYLPYLAADRHQYIFSASFETPYYTPVPLPRIPQTLSVRLRYVCLLNSTRIPVITQRKVAVRGREGDSTRRGPTLQLQSLSTRRCCSKYDRPDMVRDSSSGI